ncbi:hypothetical protein EI77_01776 [Prosthecobacter fusiformis]|uniref:Uncharacterized protein n=1 Tax=Prosthecobacter fusiformis TaxID=48464 RepID=A0A4R7S6J3_9BACT|nr:hypothetical protein EI77_01776 [Prosthecobacter fusiformis]
MIMVELSAHYFWKRSKATLMKAREYVPDLGYVGWIVSAVSRPYRALGNCGGVVPLFPGLCSLRLVCPGLRCLAPLGLMWDAYTTAW